MKKIKATDKDRDFIMLMNEMLYKIDELVGGYNQQQKDNDYFQRKIDELINRKKK